MTSDLAKLMEYIDSLQSEAVPEPVIKTEETKVHPLLQAMRELKEEGIIESVDAHTIYSNVQSGHREPDDFIEGDIGDRIYWFDDYKLSSLPIASLNLDEHYVDDDLVDDYIEYIKDSPKTMPPIVYDPIAKSIIDGIHRANAYAKLGYDTIPAYVGLTKSDSYGEREELDEAKESIKDQIEKAIIVNGGNIDDYFVRSSRVDKLGFSAKQEYKRHPDVDDPRFYLEYVGTNRGKPALWFYPAAYYLKQNKAYATEFPYTWLVKIKPNAWLQPVDDKTTSIEDAPDGKERVGILKKSRDPQAVFFRPSFDVVDKFYNFQHQRHGQVKGPQVDETISTGQGGGSAGNGGAQMVGGPTTYEEEYGMFKSKGPRRIIAMTNEALDSSYPYEGKAISGRYTFETEDGVFYKVYFQGKDLVEIAFSAILPGEEEQFRPDKTTITGTGNSRKVFGTVVKIVQDYVEANEPKALYFIAGDEPSRIRLYQTMTDQVGKALPDYYAVKPTDLGTGKAFMLKRKTKKVDEALDSSYEYRNSEHAPGQVFYFDTDDGSEYRVEFGGTGKAAEVAFERLGKDNEYKIGLTGTGDSRKIFGTVINIVKDYMSKAKPDMLIFNANNSEPSRLRLYKMLAGQADNALPDYKFAKALNDGSFTTYYLTRNGVKVPVSDKIKAAGFKALDKVFENVETTSLDKIYHGMRPDHDEMIWNYVGDSDFDTEFPIETINPTKLGLYLRSQYSVEDLEELFDMMDDDQEILVNHYMKEPNLSNEIVVMYDGKVVDGNHRALAAALTNKPIRYIDIGEEDESS